MALRIFVIPPSAMLTDHLPHGDGLVAFGFIQELGRRGHELHVAAGGLDLRGGLPESVTLHRLGPSGRARFMLRARRLYRRLAAERSFDLVHQLNPVDVGVSLALVDARPPTVLGPYVPDWEGSSSTALRVKGILRAAQQRRAAIVLLSTPAAASKLNGAAGGRAHVHELPMGIDERAWLPPATEPTGQDVLFLANLERRKGIHVLLDAFARLAPDLPEARLLVAGVGAEQDAVRRRVGESPALDRVELLGRVERERVAAAMRSCDVYCLPSYGEPYGMTALEAMACGRPLVVTSAGGLGHLVPDEGARKVPPGDAGALAGALAELLADPALRRSMGEHNRAEVERRYSWSRVVDRLEECYSEAVRASGRNS